MYFLALNILCCLLVLASLVYAQMRTDLRYPPSTGFVHLQQPMNPRHPLAQGLEGWWRVVPGRAGGPIWYDLTGKHHGTLQTMATADTTGWGTTVRPGGQGEMRFDGTAAYIDAGTAGNFTSEQFTVALWVKPNTLNLTGTDKSSMLVYKGGFADKGWFLQHAGREADVGEISFVCNQAGALQEIDSSPGYLTVGQWQHLAVTKTGSVGQIFYNGVEVTYLTHPALTDPLTSSNSLQFGRYEDDLASFHLNGAIDDVRLWSRALSASEIATVYRESQQGEPTLLTRLLPVALTPVARSGGFSIFFQGR